jgi:hypothetical protein
MKKKKKRFRKRIRLVFGRCPERGLSQINTFRDVYEREEVRESFRVKERLRRCEQFSEKSKRLSTGIVSPWKLKEGTAKVTQEVVGFEHRPKRVMWRLSQLVPDVKAPVLSSGPTKDTDSKDEVSFEYVSVKKTPKYSIPSFRYRETNPRFYSEIHGPISRVEIDRTGVERLTPTLSRHPSFVNRDEKKIKRIREVREDLARRLSVDEIVQVIEQVGALDRLDDGDYDDDGRRKLSRRPSFLDRGEKMENIKKRRRTKIKAIDRILPDSRSQVLDCGGERIHDRVDSGEKTGRRTLYRHPSFLDMDHDVKIKRREVREDLARRLSADEMAQVLEQVGALDQLDDDDDGDYDNNGRRKLSRHPSFLDRGEKMENIKKRRRTKIKAIDTDSKAQVYDRYERIHDKIDSSDDEAKSVRLSRHPSFLDMKNRSGENITNRRGQQHQSRRMRRSTRTQLDMSDIPSQVETPPIRLSSSGRKNGIRASIVDNNTTDVTRSYHEHLMRRRREQSSPTEYRYNDRRVSTDRTTHVQSPSPALSALSPRSPLNREFLTRTTKTSTTRRRKLSTVQEEERYEFPPNEIPLSPDIAVPADSHETREPRAEELMPRKFFRRRPSRRISFDDEIDQPEVLMRRKPGRVLIPDIFRGRNEDSAKSSSYDRGEKWDIPDWMPKKRAVRRQTQSHEHDHVKSAARRARDMWNTRSKKDVFRPPGLPLVNTSSHRKQNKPRSGTEPFGHTLTMKSTPRYRSKTDGSTNVSPLPINHRHNRPARVSFVSVPSPSPSRIRRISDVEIVSGADLNSLKMKSTEDH